MFTYKFKGLDRKDAGTPYYYGSVPREAEPGQTLYYPETGNRYRIVKVEGKGLEGDNDAASQKKLADADIVRREKVPTIRLKRLEPGPEGKKKTRPTILPSGEIIPTGSTYEELKESSQKNRRIRLKKKSE